MYSSEHFGRLFWVDDELEFMTCPQFTDGTGDFDREEYVSDWTDLEGVNIGLLLCDLTSTVTFLEASISNLDSHGVK